MVRIITDSAADLEPREYEKLDVICIPLRVAFSDAEYQENVDLSKDRFYELLLGSAEFPKTAQASPVPAPASARPACPHRIIPSLR